MWMPRNPDAPVSMTTDMALSLSPASSEGQCQCGWSWAVPRRQRLAYPRAHRRAAHRNADLVPDVRASVERVGVQPTPASIKYGRRVEFGGGAGIKVVRQRFRRQGLMYEFAAATVGYGRQVGARVLEGYPTEPPPRKTVIWGEASVGLLQVFLDAGYEVETSPTLRRRVVRHRLGASSSRSVAQPHPIGIPMTQGCG